MGQTLYLDPKNMIVNNSDTQTRHSSAVPGVTDENQLSPEPPVLDTGGQGSLL